VGVTVPDPDVTLFMMIVTHDVWFRSFRDELSLNVKYFIKSQESHVRFRRKISGNVPIDTDQVRPVGYWCCIELRLSLEPFLVETANREPVQTARAGPHP
jgi:hypothetical protein